MDRKTEIRATAILLGLACGLAQAAAQDTGGFRKIVSLNDAGTSGVYLWTDIANTYVLRDGDKALLIDLGDGSVLDHLPEIGVRHVEWVLFTHHHREQSQGYPRLKPHGASIGAPEAERALFEQPASFRKMRPALEDRFTVYGASFVRPPIQPIPVTRGFARMDEFVWRGQEIRCLETKGNSPGSMSYFLKTPEGWAAFSGDVMLDGARMHTWFDTEWDYGYGSGFYALRDSAALIESFDPAVLLPSHGPVIRQPKGQLREYQEKLRSLVRLLLRGFEIQTFAGADQDRVSKPSAVPHLWQVTPHLYKLKGPDYWPNLNLLVADSGHALAVDCGLIDNEFLDRTLEHMRERLGLKQVDACIVSHMHGDHALNAPHLREKWGTRVWALENMVDKLERPGRFDYAAMIESYGPNLDSVPVDRAFRPGETFEWEGYRLTVDWMPGQTEFALCLSGEIDGKRVAFTGDNIFGATGDPAQSGHEAPVARNSAVLEEGYIYGAEFLQRLKPDLLLGGHSWVMDHPAALIERYRQWAYSFRKALQSVSADEDYRYWFDPYWVRAEPYRVALTPAHSETVTLHVRNFRARAQEHHIEIHTPPGVVATPAVLDGSLPAGAKETFSVRLTAGPSIEPGVKIVGLDVTLDRHRYGEWFDFMVEVK